MRFMIIGLAALAFSGHMFLASVHAGAPAKGPEDVFKAATEAAKKEDFKTFMSHLTKDSQSAMAGSMVMMLGVAKLFAAFDPKKGPDYVKGVEELLKKHELSEDAIAANMKDLFTSKDPKVMLKGILSMGAMVKEKDRAAFVEAVVKSMAKLDPKMAKEMKELGEGSVKDVKITGDTATAAATMKEGGKDVTTTMHFKRVDGAWRIDLLPMLEAKLLMPPQ